MISLPEFIGRLRAIWRPELYHGHGKTRNFFEGWYYKLVDASACFKMAVIPGIFLASDEDESHSFIQVLNGSTGQSEYHTFAVDDFSADTGSFLIKVGESEFSLKSMRLRLDSDLVLSADVKFKGLTSWPNSIFSPGIMGPFGLIPRMQCYHGVLSMEHDICGQIQKPEREIDLDGGRGYMEKDWGRGFPDDWIWLQCNHFQSTGTSLMISMASVPWGVTRFRGFLIGFLHDGRLYTFTTYNRSKTKEVTIEEDWLKVVVCKGSFRLEVSAERGVRGVLHSPDVDYMQERVLESMSGSVCVKLTKNADVIFEGDGRSAAIEVMGDFS